MSLSISHDRRSSRAPAFVEAGQSGESSAPAFHVIRRNGSVTPFDGSKIAVAVTKAFLAVEGSGAAASRRVHEAVEALTSDVVATLTRRADADRALHIEDIQDQVELALMRAGWQKVARAYVLYREARAEARRAKAAPAEAAAALRVRHADGSLTALDEARLALIITEACAGLEGVSTDAVQAETRRNLYDGVSPAELQQAPVMAARTLIETEPNYAYVSARLLLDMLRTEALSAVGMRNSNCMAIAPTATISNICGVSQSIEPAYQNLFVKSNMSGDFTVVNASLVHDLKARGLWDEVMVSDLKYFDGSLAAIDRVPGELKSLYATAFEIESSWLIEAASRRQKWIDQAQSLNLYIASPSGKALDALYRLAWRRGLKTTYYLRSRSATHVEKSTLKGVDGRLNAVASASIAAQPILIREGAACSMDDPTCEACQ